MSDYLAFDLGASSGRAVLGTLADRRMRMRVVHRFRTPMIERGGHLHWDVDKLWRELQTGFQRALGASPRLRSLSVDSWAVDYVALDREGRPLRMPYCYRDPRTEGALARAFATVPAEQIYEYTGIQFLPFNTLFQLLADRAEGAPPAHRCLPIADYFNYRFSGRAVVEVSMASTTQLMDVRTRDWCAPLAAAFGLDLSAWPPIVPSCTLLGPASGATDVAVIATCSHDTGAAVAAAPVVDTTRRWAYVSSGTWSLLGVERTGTLLTPAACAAGFTHEAGVDGTIRFLKNLTGLWALQECVREWGRVAWPVLQQEALAAPACRTLVDLEDPRFLARGAMVERLRGWCREHRQPVPESRGALVRALLESIAASYARALRDLERVTGESIELLHVFGGGSRNRLLCQLAADACGIPVIAGPAEATALGNLLLQARALGHLPARCTVRQVAARSTRLHRYQPTTRVHHASDR